MTTPLSKIRKSNDRYVIFYDDGCYYSEEAIKLLQSKGVPYKAYRIADFTDLPTLVSYFTKTSQEETGFLPSHKTKPIVFNKGKFLGGKSELARELA